MVRWAGSPLGIIWRMLDLAQIGSEDVVYDLGSGDGRILISAVAEFGAKKAVGYEIRQDLCQIAEREIHRLCLQSRIEVVEGNFLDADLWEASVITLYLSREANELLRPKLEAQARAQSRVVSYLFPISGWRIADQVDLEGCSCSEGRFIGTIYLYHIPEAFEHKSPTC